MITPVYRSQWGKGATARVNDCGPTCVSMFLYAIGDFTPVDQLRTNDKTGLTSAADLVRIFAEHGVTAHAEKVAGLDDIKPNSILLVNYAPLSKYAQDTRFKGWHWLIGLHRDGSEWVTHDPDYGVRGSPASEGDSKRYPYEALKVAFRPYYGEKLATAVVVDGVIEVEDTDTMAEVLYVKNDKGLNIRKQPAGKIIAEAKDGTKVTTLDHVKVAPLGKDTWTWEAVVLPDETIGYVAREFLTDKPPA